MVFFLGLACLFGGFVAISPLLMEKYPGLKKFDEKISPYKIIVGLAILIIGLIKFIAPFHRDGRPLIPLFGDFLPAVLAILLGAFISIEFLETLKGVRNAFVEKLKNLLQKYHYPFGFAAILFGILHWVLYKFIFF